jgi:hypothetical protein
MRLKTIVGCLTLFLLVPRLVFSQNDEEKIHVLVQQFFDVIGKKDSIAYHALFLKDGYRYTWSQRKDSIVTSGSSAFAKPTFQAKVKYKEVMRPEGVKIEIHKNIAMAWVPYDFFVNDQFSHCGVDVFTYMKTRQGWKIAVIAYSVERDGCSEW